MQQSSILQTEQTRFNQSSSLKQVSQVAIDADTQTATQTANQTASQQVSREHQTQSGHSSHVASTTGSSKRFPKTFYDIPRHRPNTPLLDSIDNPNDLNELNIQQLLTLADELREYLLYSAGVSGGHFGANLVQSS